MAQNPPTGGGAFGALFRRSKKEDSDDGSRAAPAEVTSLSEATKQKAVAAKEYIEKMYKQQYQNLAERSSS